MSHRQIRVTLGFPTDAARDEAAGYMSRCPHALACERQPERRLMLHFCVPAEKLGWAQALAAEPAFVGGDTGLCEQLPNTPDRSGEVNLTPHAEPPCGASCSKCPHYLKRCGGCPVTPHYRAGHRWE